MASLTIAPAVSPAISSRFQSQGALLSGVETRTVLTARGRRVVALAVVALAVMLAYALSGLLSAAVAASDAPLAAPALTYVLVEPGDTLWSVASKLDPQGDPRALVDRIATLNALSSDAQLQVGQTLAVPSID